MYQGIAPDFISALRLGAFQSISAMTTTGYTTDAFYTWPGFVPIMLIVISIIGGCAGSTAGGMKIVRVMLLSKQMLREIRHLIHPSAVLAIKFSHRTVNDQVIGAVWAFFFLYVATIVCCGMLLHAIGLDLVTAFSATIACLTNLGPAIGEAGPNYGSLSAPAKLILSAIMLLGRLEIFTLLVLFTPSFWKD
jgi:trk system potassium uptake protein TrkH